VPRKPRERVTGRRAFAAVPVCGAGFTGRRTPFARERDAPAYASEIRAEL